MSINFSNTTPAPPAGDVNVTWQTDGSGNVSAYVNPEELVVTPSFQLGSSAAYAILAAAGITNTGSSVITGGNVGSYPTATITPGAWTLTPPAVIDNTNAQAAQTAALLAYNYYAGLTPTLSGLSDLSTGGNGSTPATYLPGVYSGSSSLTMPSGIVLDAQGNAGAVFVFIAGSTINLASGQSVTLINGAQASNVFWIVGSYFTAVATSTMVGTILANTSITLGGGTLNGRAIAGIVTVSGAVTIAAATNITVPGNAVVLPPSPVEVFGPKTNFSQSLNPTLTADFNAGSAFTLFTPTVAGAYRISWSQAIVIVASISSTFPSLTLAWTDVGGISRTKVLVATSTTNTTAVESDGDCFIYVESGVAVTVTSASYASVAAGMTYALALAAEQL